jgi:hypothetical protein
MYLTQVVKLGIIHRSVVEGRKNEREECHEEVALRLGIREQSAGIRMHLRYRIQGCTWGREMYRNHEEGIR